MQQPSMNLSARQREQLGAFLQDPARPGGTLNLRRLQGLLFALAAAPEPVAPSQWLPLVFGGDSGVDEVFGDAAEAEGVIHALIALYNEVAAAVAAGEPTLPQDCQPLQPPVANFEPGTPLSDWSTGVELGQQLLSGQWLALLPPELEDEYDACMMALTFFADDDELRQMAAEEARESGKSVEELAQLIVRMLPDVINGYALLGRSIGAEVQAPARAESIGRNEPCPCGSGKKYKRCCGGVTLH